MNYIEHSIVDFTIASVTLSFLIAILSSYIALYYARELSTKIGKYKLNGLLVSSFAMGFGIWAMHFVAMLSYKSMIPMGYSIMLIFLSLISPIITSLLALLIVTKSSSAKKRFVIGGLVNGIGISLMHFIGMEAMQMQGSIVYDKWLVSLSVVLAIVFSAISFGVTYLDNKKGRMFVASLIMSIGIIAMHYTALEAMKMIHEPTLEVHIIPNEGYFSPATLAAIIGIVTLGILFISLLNTISEKNLALGKREESENKLYEVEFEYLNTVRQQQGMTFKFREIDGKFIHTLCGGELMYKLGFEEEDVVGKALTDFVPESILRLKLDAYEQAWAGQNVNYEGIINGIHYYTTLRPIFKAGQVIEVIGSSTDISQRKAIEEKHKEDNELYRAILTSMQDGVVGFDLKGKVITANHRASKTFGFKHNDFLDRIAGDGIKFLKEDGSKMQLEEYPVVRAIKEKKAVNGEVVGFYHGDGEIRYLLTNVEPLYSPNEGGMNGVVCTFSDITDQKNKERKILEYNSLLRTMVENLNFGVIVTDENDKVLLGNQMFCKIFNLEFCSSNLSDRTIVTLRNEVQNLLPDLPNYKMRVNEILKNRKPVVDVIRFTDERIFERFYVPFFFENQYTGNLWIYNDVTEQRNLESKLIKSSEEAIKANLAKSEFLSKMSHELRTPLNGVFGFAQLLELDESLTSEQKENVEEILNAGRHLLHLINDVLDLARIEAGTMQFIPNHVDIKQVIKECVNMVTPMADAKNIRISVQFSKINDVYVHADPVRLKQAIINLLDNAIKYNTQDGNVTVELSINERTVAIHIKDNGYGIDDSDMNDIFKPFFRSKLTSDYVSGTGIGLPLVKQLVESMSGKISVDSQIGVESTFTVSFPILTNEVVIKSKHHDSTLELCCSNQVYNILYIEDNESNQKIVEKYLKDIPYINVSYADYGLLGIQLAKQKHFDLILLDLNLPDIHGYEVFEALRNNEKTNDIPIVAVSANAIQRDITHTLDLGFADYVTKPYDLNKLLNVIKGILETKRTEV
jgi:PAS domain S-box-containing protein